jgi:hypothetical protein
MICALALLGAPLARAAWSPGGVRVCLPPCAPFIGGQLEPDGSGGAYVLWLDGRDSLYLQRIDADGNLSPGWPAAGLLLTGSAHPSVLMGIAQDSSGGVLMAWRSRRLGSSVVMERRMADGSLAPGWPDTGAVAVDAFVGPSLIPVAADGQGGGYTAWQDFRVTFADQNVYAQRFAADGSRAPGWPPNGLPVCTATGNQYDPVLLPDGHGGVFVAWWDEREVSRTRIFAQRLLPSGLPAPGWPVNGVPLSGGTGYALFPAIASDGAGGAYVAWSQDIGSGTNRTIVFLQRVGSDGSIENGWPADGLALGPGYSFETGLAADGEGAYVSWTYNAGTSEVADFRARMQHALSFGAIAPGWPDSGLAPGAAARNQAHRALVADGAGGAIVVWSHFEEDARTFARRVTASGSPAAGWPVGGLPMNGLQPLFATDAATDGDHGVLVLMQGYATPAELVIQRATGSGVIAPGWPGYPSSSLLISPFPNPTAESAVIGFALPTSGRLRVHVHDVRGRLVRTLADDRDYGAGQHRLRWDGRDDDGVELPAGIYWIRVRAGALEGTRRIALIR